MAAGSGSGAVSARREGTPLEITAQMLEHCRERTHQVTSRLERVADSILGRIPEVAGPGNKEGPTRDGQVGAVQDRAEALIRALELLEYQSERFRDYDQSIR